MLNLVLQDHQVADRLVAFVWVVDSLQANILLVFESTVELGVLLVERELGEQEIDVFSDKWSISANTFACQSSIKTIDPASVVHGFLESRRMAFLQDLVNSNERLESLNLVGHNRLARDGV